MNKIKQEKKSSVGEIGHAQEMDWKFEWSVGLKFKIGVAFFKVIKHTMLIVYSKKWW